MSQRRHLTVVAAAASLLAAMPLAAVFGSWTWLIEASIAVGVMAGVAIVIRSLRTPEWLPSLAMGAAFVLVLTVLFSSGGEIGGILPTPSTLEHFNSLLTTAGQEVRSHSAPVEDRPGFLFLAVLGIGGVALLVDVFAVVLRRPALAGLPMLAIYSVPVAVRSGSVSMWLFALGAAGFLWLLVTDNIDRVRRFGRRFTGDGRDVDAWEPSPLAAAGQRLGLIGITLAVLLPLAVPGMTGGLLQRFGDGGLGSGTGSGSGVGLYALLSGELNRDRTINMVKVSSNDPNPYYLRFAVADQLTPNGFTVRSLPPGRPVSEDIPENRVGPGGVSHDFQATVEVVNMTAPYLPVYLQPTKVSDIDDSWQYDESQAVIFSSRNEAPKKKYTFDYTRVDYPAEALQRATPLPSGNPLQQRFTQTPRSAEVDAIVAELVAGKTTPYAKVRAIFDHFAPAYGFSYSLTTQPGNSGNQLIDFLKNKKGYCVQYSAALAWMVRSAGIPARVAFGFTRGGGSPGGTATLTNFNLHAWTEVYFDGFGWLPFDATPATNIAGSASPAYAPNPSRPSDAQLPLTPDLPVAEASPEQSSAAQTGGQPRDARPDAGGGPLTPVTLQWPIWMTLGVIVALAVLLIPATRRVAVRRRRLRGQPGAREYAHAAWDELLDTMTDYRLPIDDAETPRATAERLVRAAALADEPAAGVTLLGLAEERARYATTPAADELRPALAGVRAALATRASRRTRVLAGLLPPSVLQRWRFAVAGAASQAFNAVALGAERTARTLSVRRALARRSGS